MLAEKFYNSKIKNGITAVKYKMSALFDGCYYVCADFKYFSPFILKIKSKDMIRNGLKDSVFDLKMEIKQKRADAFFKNPIIYYRICI